MIFVIIISVVINQENIFKLKKGDKMANIASQIKRIKTNEKRNEINKSYKSKVKTALKKAEISIKNKTENASTLVNEACSLIDKAVNKGIFHINKAARKKSKIMIKLTKSK